MAQRTSTPEWAEGRDEGKKKQKASGVWIRLRVN